MKKAIFLDDLRWRDEAKFTNLKEQQLFQSWNNDQNVDFVTCRDAWDFYDQIDYWEECPSFISFDHDIASYKDGQEITGYDLAKWLVEKDLDAEGNFIPKDFQFTVHSANPEGSKNIRMYLNNYLTKRGT